MKYLPIDKYKQDIVIEKTNQFIGRGEELFGRRFGKLPIVFDLTGRSAGMYVIRNGNQFIRYNPYIFAKYFIDNLQQTVPHEVAHYIVDEIYGFHNVRPHGHEWKEIMTIFGASIRATCNYNLDGIPSRQLRRHNYACDCNHYALTSRRHNKIIHHRAKYFCKKCGAELRLQRAIVTG